MARRIANPGIIPLKHPCLKLIGSEHLRVVQQVTNLGKKATLNAWIAKVAQMSLAMTWPGISLDDRLTFRGDALELLSEYLLKSCPHHTKHGVSQYTIVPIREDFGVDATGVNILSEVVVIQCKFRKNPLDLIHYSDMARTFTSGVISYGLNPQAKKVVWLVTTANDANINAHKVMGRRLHVLGKGHLQSQVNNNVVFWNNFLGSIQKTINAFHGSLSSQSSHKINLHQTASKVTP